MCLHSPSLRYFSLGWYIPFSIPELIILSLENSEPFLRASDISASMTPKCPPLSVQLSSVIQNSLLPSTTCTLGIFDSLRHHHFKINISKSKFLSFFPAIFPFGPQHVYLSNLLSGFKYPKLKIQELLPDLPIYLLTYI